MTPNLELSKILKPAWALYVLSFLLVADFFLGGAVSSPVVRWVPGLSHRYAGTLVLALLLVLAHVLLWLRSPHRSPREMAGHLWQHKEVWGLGFLVLFAAWSRLSTLGWDLQHGEDGYEGHFLRAVRHMLDTGDLNHRYHEYPGLFLYMLLGAFVAGFVVAVGARWGTTLDNIPSGYFLKIGRGLVAFSSVLNVPLTFSLGRVGFNRRVGLLAAALVCFSYLELQTSQNIRPDVLLETFVVIALLQILRLLERPTLSFAALAGMAVGAATAVKYTGFLVVVPFVVAAAFAGSGKRLSRLLVGLGGMLAAYAVLSPYSFLDLPGFLYGVSEQAQYNMDPSLRPAENMARFYTTILAAYSIGYPALILVFVGLAQVLTSPRRHDVVLVSYVVVYLLFFFLSPVQFNRFLLPALPVLAVYAGHGFDWAVGWSCRKLPRAGWLIASVGAVVVFAGPASSTWRLVEWRRQPSVRDEARAWMDENLPASSRVAVSRLGPSLEGGAFTSSRFVRFDQKSLPALRNFDFAVSAAIDSPETLTLFHELARFQPLDPTLGNEQVVLQVPEGERARYRRVEIQADELSSSDHEADLVHLVDGDLRTVWRGEEGERRQRIDIRFSRSLALGKVVLVVPKGASESAASLRVLGSTEGRHYSPIDRFLLNEKVSSDSGLESLTLFVPAPAIGFLRLVEPRVSRGVLEIAEIEIHEAVGQTAGR